MQLPLIYNVNPIKTESESDLRLTGPKQIDLLPTKGFLWVVPKSDRHKLTEDHLSSFGCLKDGHPILLHR